MPFIYSDPPPPQHPIETKQKWMLLFALTSLKNLAYRPCLTTSNPLKKIINSVKKKFKVHVLVFCTVKGQKCQTALKR